MPNKRKRKRPATTERPTIHPRNKYSDNPPGFGHLASLYPSFQPYVFYSRDGRPRIDWTDFNATRELTRVLLLHDHGLNWWIPDGQLCPTVPNRSNYIHWIEDLLSSDIIIKNNAQSEVVRGFDIGTGANCIYPLLGASLLGWNFVGSDMTDVGIEWAEKNVKSNPHISDLIEIRKVHDGEKTSNEEQSRNDVFIEEESSTLTHEIEASKEEPSLLSPLSSHSGGSKSYQGPPILSGVVKDDETFDFCMCNPPFFESMEEAGLNPKTSCGGTPDEMVCPGGEKAFISRIIQDSIQLKQSFRWYTSMVGRKANLKFLISELREAGVTIVKTTEFVQGQTCRWGLAWSFMPPSKKIISSNMVVKSVLSFMLEGLQRQCNAIHVLQSVESFFCNAGASCKMNTSAFTVDITVSTDHYNAILKNQQSNIIGPAPPGHNQAMSNGLDCSHLPPGDLPFRVAIFQQTPGTLLVRGSLQHKDSPLAGVFSLVFTRLEEVLKDEFCREKVQARY